MHEESVPSSQVVLAAGGGGRQARPIPGLRRRHMVASGTYFYQRISLKNNCILQAKAISWELNQLSTIPQLKPSCSWVGQWLKPTDRHNHSPRQTFVKKVDGGGGWGVDGHRGQPAPPPSSGEGVPGPRAYLPPQKTCFVLESILISW